MTLKNDLIDKILQILFYFLCLFYIVFYMPYGFEGTDTGYIFGSSWNIYNGQLPHRDFIYTRPAIPAFFHTIFLFFSETYGYLMDRSFFYIQVFLYSFLGAKLITQHFSITSKALLYFMAILGAIFSIHNYPPMGWNTIDGIFFCMIGLYLILKKNSAALQLLIGSFCIVLGMFSKQSFYFIPLFIFIYLVFNKDFYRLKLFSLFGFVFFLSYLGFKYATDSLIPFYEQTFQRASGSGLVNAGIKTYYLALKFNFFYVLGVLITICLGIKYIKKKYIYLIVNLGIASYMIYVFYQDDFTQWTTIKYLFQLLFMGSVGFSLYMLRKDKRYLLILLLLTISWSASLSNGYQTPIHFSLPLVFSLYLFFFNSSLEEKKSELNKLSNYITFSIIALFLITFYFGYQTIYNDSARKELTYNMEEVFPQLKFIKSDFATFEKYKELKVLSSKYSNFTVIPSVTLAHYLTKTVNPMGIDWPLDVEINNEAQKLIEQLSNKNTIVFIENTGFSKQELEGYEIKFYIEKNWKLVEKNKYFNVYSLPN